MEIAADVTRAELVEALTNLNHTAKRLPRHYIDRRAAVHAEIDKLLWELQMRGELRAAV